MLVSIIFLLVLFSTIINSEDVFVEIPQGKIKGYTDTTIRYKKPFVAFKGLPYAKPRVAEDKFEVCEMCNSNLKF